MKRVAFILVLMALTGCTTRVVVERVTAANEATVEGVRYYLPQPYLLVTPAADGTITVTKKYLPDLDRQYAVRSTSYLAKHKLIVDVTEEGFLQQFGSKSDSTEAAKTAFEQAATFMKARADAEATAAKESATAVAAAEDAVVKAAALVQSIRLEIDEINNSTVDAPKKAELLLNARIRLAKAEIDLANAERARAALRGGSSMNIAGGGGNNAMNVGGGGATDFVAVGSQSASQFPRTWGPMLLKIVDDGTSVKLEPVQWPVTVKRKAQDGTETTTTEKRDQVQFATQTIKPEAAKKSVVTPNGQIRLQLRQTAGNLRFTIESDTELVSVNGTLAVLARNDNPMANAQVITALSTDKRTISITLPQNLPAGQYKLTLPVKVKEEGKDVGKEMEVAFEVVP